jgi:hypothetical protein
MVVYCVMNNGQSHPSATIRALTDERFLAAYRAVVMLAVGVVGFFLVRLVNAMDESARTMEAFKTSIHTQVSDIKIEVARNTANTSATIAAIHGRMDAQSRRMDGFDTDLREVNKKLYDGRRAAP